MTSSSSPFINTDSSHYVVTSHNSGSVGLTCKCNFISTDVQDILVSKGSGGNRNIEIKRFINTTKYTDNNKNDDNNDTNNQQQQQSQQQSQLLSFYTILNIPINGRITCMIPMNLPTLTKKTSCLFITTDQYRYAIISYYDGENNNNNDNTSFSRNNKCCNPYPIITHASGSLQRGCTYAAAASASSTSRSAGGEDDDDDEDNNVVNLLANTQFIGREAECSPLFTIDPTYKVICIHLYDGVLSFIPINHNGGEEEASLLLGPLFHCRIEERTIIQISFLESSSKHPHVTLLHQDSKGDQHIVTHMIDLQKKKMIYNYKNYNDTAEPPSATIAQQLQHAQQQQQSQARDQASQQRPQHSQHLQQHHPDESMDTNIRGRRHGNKKKADILAQLGVGSTETSSSSSSGGALSSSASSQQQQQQQPQMMPSSSSSSSSAAPPTSFLIKKNRIDGGSSILIPVSISGIQEIDNDNDNEDGNNASSPGLAASQSSVSMTDADDDNKPHAASRPLSSTSSYCGGLLVIGLTQITYLNIVNSEENRNRRITKLIDFPSPFLIVSHDELPPVIDGQSGSITNRYLLGDEYGNLHLLLVHLSTNQEKGNVTCTDLQLNTLGQCVVSSSIQYIGDAEGAEATQGRASSPTTSIGSAMSSCCNGFAFIGSQFGDSQLIQIHDEPILIHNDHQDGDHHDRSSSHTTTTPMMTKLAVHQQEQQSHEKSPRSTLPTPPSLSYISIIEEYTSLGPIVDFDLVPTTGTTTAESSQQQVQSQVITASGSSSQSGSLRLISNGIGMNEYASVNINGIQNMWSIRNSFSEKEDTYLIQSFVGETRILGIVHHDNEEEEEHSGDNDNDNTMAIVKDAGDNEDNEEVEEEDDDDVGGSLEEVCLDGIDSTSSTLYVSNVHVGDTIVQITETQIRLIETKTMTCIDTWSPSSITTTTTTATDQEQQQRLITIASGNESGQIALALRGGMLCYFIVEEQQQQQEEQQQSCKIVPVHNKQMDREISCIDLNPFKEGAAAAAATSHAASSAMEVDDDEIESTKVGTSTAASALSSSVVAVGLWDDFTVRILSLGASSSPLEELLLIDLSAGVNDDDEVDVESLSSSKSSRRGSRSDGGGDNGFDSRANRNNMMARSLCLITLDSSSSSSSTATPSSLSALQSNTNGTSGSGVNMLFVGLGDGTLISFAVVFNGTAASTGTSEESTATTIMVRSKKEVSLGTQRINLIPLQTEFGGSCVLATGDRPTIIYLAGGGGSISSNAGSSVTSRNFSNPKLCYSNINLSTSTVDDEGDEHDNSDISRPPSQQSIAVNVATSFSSPLLFDTTPHHSLSSSPLSPLNGNSGNSKNNYSLCISDDSNLRLGVIDDIQKLHVTTCKLGMSPRRVVHCSEGRLFAVGCIDDSGDDQHVNMGNCIRFLDDTAFDDIERIDMDPYEMILSMVHADLCIADSCFQGRPDQSMNSVDGTSYKQYLVVGTAYVQADEEEPTKGRIILYSFNSDDVVDESSRRADGGGGAHLLVRKVAELVVKGGVHSVCQFYDGKLLAAVNSMTNMVQLSDDGAGILSLNLVGIGHHGHILSLCVRSRAGKHSKYSGQIDGDGTEMVDETVKNNSRSEQRDQLAIVGDLMRSISLVQYYPTHKCLEEIARDFHANFTTAIEMLTDDIYIGAESWNNLYVLRRNTNPQSSDEARCRLDTVGEFHLGEMVNKIMAGTLTMPHSISSSSSSSTSSSVSHTKGITDADGIGVKGPGTNTRRRPRITIGSQSLFGTVDGTLGVVLGLDVTTTIFFLALQRCMEQIVQPVGNFSHREYRSFDGEENRIHVANGFIDGDFIESFLDFDRSTMQCIVDEMNHSGSWDIEHNTTVSSGVGRKRRSVNKKKKTSTSTSEGGGSRRGSPADGTNSSTFFAGNDTDDIEEMSTSGIGSESNLTVEEVLAMVEEMTMLH